MKRKSIAAVISTSILISSAVYTSAVPASAASCTAKEISYLHKVDMQMAIASLSGDLTDLFAAIAKARNATKNKTLKDFYQKLETAVEEDNGVLQVGESRKMWRTLQSKYQYNRC
jgi:hypothetical protein